MVVAVSGRTTATGQWLRCSTAWLTEPSTRPAKLPRPREPTTTSCASSDSSDQRPGRPVAADDPPDRHVGVLLTPAGQPLGEHDLLLLGDGPPVHHRRHPRGELVSVQVCTAISGTPRAAAAS